MPFNTALPADAHSRYGISEVIKFEYCREGFEWDHATEGGDFGEHEPIRLEFGDSVIETGTKREFYNIAHVTAEIPLIENSVQRLKTVASLCLAPHNLRGYFADGRIFHFFKNSAAAGLTPTGTAMVGATFEYTIDRETQKILYKAETDVYREELVYAGTIMGTATATGQVSGSAIPMDAMAYNRDHHFGGGIRDIQIADVSLGIWGDPSFKIYSMPHPKRDQRGRPVRQWIMFEGTMYGHADDATMYNASFTRAFKDEKFEIIMDDGRTVQCDANVLSIIPKYLAGDDEGWIEYRLRGRVPHNSACFTINTSSKLINLLKPVAA